MTGDSARLWFTMASHSQSDRLHTSFQPSPSPVVLQKFVGPSQSHVVGDRLALAVRLARRDLQHGLTHRSTCLPSPQAVSNSSHKKFSVESVRTEGGGVDTCGRGGGGDVTDHRHGVKQSGVKEDGDGKGAKTSGGTSGELVQLKLELNHQVQRLRELCARKAVHRGRGEEEERERRKSAEQVSMMARKLYDLQHQVWATGVKGKPPLGRKRLAAARRAATRALHNYTSTPHPLPSELLQMVEVLCGRGDRQSAQLLSLAQMYSDTLRIAHQQGRCRSPSQQSAVKHKRKRALGRKKKGCQQCGVVWPQSLRSRGGFIHFSQPTLSSAARSRPSVRCSTHTPPQVRDKEHVELTMNCKRNRKKTKQGKVRRLKTPFVPTDVSWDSGVRVGRGAGEGGKEEEDEGKHQGSDRSSPSETKPLAITPQLALCASSSNISPPLPRGCSCPHTPSTPDLSGPLGSTVQEYQSGKERRAVEIPNVVVMATTLQQMEEVEVEIRQKWNGRSYTEPLGGHHPSNTSTVPPPSSPPSPYSGTNTALVDRGEFDLWKLMKRLANDLLEESIHEVCEEVGDICSGLTKDIFSSEFFTPTVYECL